MKDERPNIIFTIVTIITCMWFLLRELTVLRRMETELEVEFVNPLIAFMVLLVLVPYLINSLIKDLRELNNQEKTQEVTKIN